MTASPFKFLVSYIREDKGSFFGSGTLMTQIFMIHTDHRNRWMPLRRDAMSDPRKSAFIRAICVPT